MGAFVDHYIILGLPSGEEGSKVSKEVIRKSYLNKASKLHPDKRSDHPNAVTDFQQLQASYEILKDDNTRKVFNDDLMIRIKQQQQQQQQQGSEHRRMMCDPPKEKVEKKVSSCSYSYPNLHSHPDFHSHLNSSLHPNLHPRPNYHSHPNSHSHPISHSHLNSHWYPSSHSYPNLHLYSNSKSYSNSYVDFTCHSSSGYSYSHYSSSSNRVEWGTQGFPMPKASMPYRSSIPCSSSSNCTCSYYPSSSHLGTWETQGFTRPEMSKPFGDSVPSSSSWSCPYNQFFPSSSPSTSLRTPKPSVPFGGCDPFSSSSYSQSHNSSASCKGTCPTQRSTRPKSSMPFGGHKKSSCSSSSEGSQATQGSRKLFGRLKRMYNKLKNI